jgi:hypothetical protein
MQITMIGLISFEAGLITCSRCKQQKEAYQLPRSRESEYFKDVQTGDETPSVANF